MSFNFERMKKVRFIPAQLNDATTVHIILEPKFDVARMIPPPLSPAEPSQAHFALNYFRKTSLPGVESYLESALILEVENDGIKGNLCIAIILNDDNAMIGGREFFGFPKKMGAITFNLNNSLIEGHVERRETILARFKCRISDEELTNYSDIKGPFGEVSFNIKCFPDPSLRKFDYPPRLVKHKIAENLKSIKPLKEISLELFSSKFDPWGEFAPFEIKNGFLREYDCTVLAGEVIAELDGDSYFPFALNRFM